MRQLVPGLDREAIGEDAILSQAANIGERLVVEEAVAQLRLVRHLLRIRVIIDYQPEFDIPVFLYVRTLKFVGLNPILHYFHIRLHE